MYRTASDGAEILVQPGGYGMVENSFNNAPTAKSVSTVFFLKDLRYTSGHAAYSPRQKLPPRTASMEIADYPPLIIEASLNGSASKEHNPAVPYSDEEIVADAIACMDAGAALIHNHTDEGIFGGSGQLDTERTNFIFHIYFHHCFDRVGINKHRLWTLV